MSDEDYNYMIRCLHKGVAEPEQQWSAYDRIEELEAENADLKAKLAKAVEALECAKDYVGATSDGDLIAHEEPKVIKYIIKEQAEEDLASICTTLAELTGGKDD